jgi:hypothetical protein
MSCKNLFEAGLGFGIDGGSSASFLFFLHFGTFRDGLKHKIFFFYFRLCIGQSN